MLIEFVRFFVYIVCVIIGVVLVGYLDLVIAEGSDWEGLQGFLIISPIAIVIAGFGISFKRFGLVILYSFASAFCLTVILFIDSFYNIPESQIEPDIFGLAYTEPFPYLLAVFGIFAVFFFIPLTGGFILGSISKRTFKQ